MAVKTGYFRITGMYETTMSYKEFYDRGHDYISYLKDLQDRGAIQLFCACQPENTLELNITKNHVIRVKNNLQQDQHLQSCPKSERYAAWIAENESGVRSNEDERICFNITIPSGIKSSGSSSSTSSSSSRTGDPQKKRTNLLMMARIVNCVAWEKQTYSIYKQIGNAHREKRICQWTYKSLEEFNRLFFGVSNEIYLQNKGEIFPLHDICYRSDIFHKADYRSKFFMYAVIDKVSEIKKERKYQYVTVLMPSKKSSKKATVRILTEDFMKIITDINFDSPTHKILTGYIRHDTFSDVAGVTSDWITLLKGAIISVSSLGLFLEHDLEASLIDILCKNKIIFSRPYHALENYRNEMPTVLIERRNAKNIIIDVCKTKKEYITKTEYIENNPEYDIILLSNDYMAEDALEKLNSLLYD